MTTADARTPCPQCGRTDYRDLHGYWFDDPKEPVIHRSMRTHCDHCYPLRLDAYYYGFTPTGVEAVDRVLAAVATAGKAFHHTAEWGDGGVEDFGAFRGGSYVAWIQNAAEDAAKVVRRAEASTARAENAALRDAATAHARPVPPPSPPLVACPFCGEPDFDLPGLKRHVVVGDCAVFEATEALRGRAAAERVAASLAPVVCVWRERVADSGWWSPACTGERNPDWDLFTLDEVNNWRGCPYCLKPLVVGTAPQGGEQ